MSHEERNVPNVSTETASQHAMQPFALAPGEGMSVQNPTGRGLVAAGARPERLPLRGAGSTPRNWASNGTGSPPVVPVGTRARL